MRRLLDVTFGRGLTTRRQPLCWQGGRAGLISGKTKVTLIQGSRFVKRGVEPEFIVEEIIGGFASETKRKGSVVTPRIVNNLGGFVGVIGAGDCPPTADIFPCRFVGGGHEAERN